MSAFDELMRAAHEEQKRREDKRPWEVLSDQILHVTELNEILDLQNEINEFMDSDAPQEDKNQLAGYLECFYMKLDAVLPGGVLGTGVITLENEE